ncbi:hypothetical protein ACFW2I_09065 [Streptomyces nigra]|uniref:hypothetical protein n=1 Tax=Streptomyces nigra TaxID=1827580 RepID=UPI0036BB6954
MTTDLIHAPWSAEQVTALNAFQHYGRMHPFTCGAEHASGQSPVLVATNGGWVCPDPQCVYRQDWAHAFMAEPAGLAVGLGVSATPSHTDQAAELERLRTENERMRHELEVMYGGAFDSLDTPPPADRAAVLRDLVHKAEEWDGHITVQELRRLADEAQQQPETETLTAIDRNALSEKLWRIAEHHIIAEWICCEPLEPRHHLCAKGYAALGMTKTLLVDSAPEEAWNPAAPVLDAVIAELEQLRRERDLAIAHDRQPYPTAWAYEQACKALRRKTDVLDRVREYLERHEHRVAVSPLDVLALLDEAQQQEPESGCAHCGGDHSWDDCQAYTAVVAAAPQPEPPVHGESVAHLAGLPDEDPNTGPGWYEVINPRNATTNIVYVHEDGSLYLPEGDDLTPEEFTFAAARGNAHRLVRADDREAHQ